VLVLSEFYGPEVLNEVGYGERSRRRKRKRPHPEPNSKHSNDDSDESEWQKLKQFLDPNPQLKGVSQGDRQPKVCCVCGKPVDFLATNCLNLVWLPKSHR